MKAPGGGGPAPAHIGALDGLRAMAIGLVLLYHLSPGHESNLGLRSLLFKVADLGWCGVDLFFVLSGFLITGKLLEARGEATPFRGFYLRRALRIFPLYYLVLLLALVAIPALSRRVAAVPFADQLPFWLYYVNFQGVALDPGSLRLGHFWSLAVEEQFYLVWPAMILLGGSRRSIRVCAAVFALAPLARLAAVWAGAGWTVTYQWTPFRADGLVVGAFLALVWDRTTLRPALARTSVAAVAVTGPALFWVAWKEKAGLIFHPLESREVLAIRVLLPTVLALFFGSLLVLALERRTLGRALSSAWLRPVARYSYGIYVFHFMLIPLLDRVIPAPRLAASLGSRNLGAFAYLAAGATASFLLAAASYHGYESWFLSWKPRRRAAPAEAAPVVPPGA